MQNHYDFALIFHQYSLYYISLNVTGLIMGFLNKFSNIKECIDNSSIYNIYYNQEIDNNIVFLESRNGNDFTGNIFRIAEEISSGKYGNFKIYVFAKKEVALKISALKKKYNLKITKVITNEKEATKILFKAKYIFTDSGILHKFVKKPKQVVLNTWHGTPLKLMGFDNVSEQNFIGIIQHSLLNSDYLLYPNDYMCHKMLNAYMIDKIYPGKILNEGYPRNSVFLDEARRSEFRKMFGMDDKEIYVYMPTFKGVVNDRKDEQQFQEVTDFLSLIDMHLNDNQVLFTKFHPYNQSKIDFTRYSHIKAFPNDFETYDIVNMADCLITDYSSVFFDFLNTRRKIIIFNYDEEEYLKERGFYFPLSDLPFPKARSIDELIDNLNIKKDYDDTELVEKFCKYDKIDSVENICNCVIKDKVPEGILTVENSKKNILIQVSDFSNKKQFDNLLEFLTNANFENYNVFITFKYWDEYLLDNHEEIFSRIPDFVEYLPVSFNLTPTFREKIELDKFLKSNSINPPRKVQRLFKRSYLRQYGHVKFDLMINFDDKDKISTLKFASTPFKKVFFTESNGDNELSKFYDVVLGDVKQLCAFLEDSSF